jgi:hypothetical protein
MQQKASCCCCNPASTQDRFELRCQYAASPKIAMNWRFRSNWRDRSRIMKKNLIAAALSFSLAGTADAAPCSDPDVLTEVYNQFWGPEAIFHQ